MQEQQGIRVNSGAAPAPVGLSKVGLVLALVIAAIGAGYAGLFQRLNAAPEFLAPYRAGDADAAGLEISSCRASVSKISVAGHLPDPGTDGFGAATTVVLRSDTDGRLYRLWTDLGINPAAAISLRGRYDDDIRFDRTAFSASLNLQASGLGVPAGELWLAVDGPDGYLLLPTACRFPVTP